MTGGWNLVGFGSAWRRLRLGPSVPRLLWWIWPSLPTSWADVPARLRPEARQVVRLTVAAVLAYLVADAVSPGILDLTAPLTALLVVQASTVGTLQMGLVRVAAVLTGVFVAVAFATYAGLSWWSLGAVIAASLVLGKLLRLGEQSLETPISAMLILAVSSHGLAAEVRVVNTLIGTAVGIGFSLLLPVSIPNAEASEAVRRVARSQAAMLDEVALTLGERAPHADEVKAWLDWADHLGSDLADAAAAVQVLEESRRLNPLALAAPTVHPGLRAILERLDRCLAAERSLLVVIGQAGGGGPDEGPRPRPGSELRRAFAVVLDDLADGLRALGDLVEAEYGAGTSGGADEAMARTREAVQETRAVLTELMLLSVDPREHADLWMLQGSVLAAVDRVLVQLDLEHTERSTEAWLARRLPFLAAAAQRKNRRSRRR
jgi:hypothetical protein